MEVKDQIKLDSVPPRDREPSMEISMALLKCLEDKELIIKMLNSANPMQMETCRSTLTELRADKEALRRLDLDKDSTRQPNRRF